MRGIAAGLSDRTVAANLSIPRTRAASTRLQGKAAAASSVCETSPAAVAVAVRLGDLAQGTRDDEADARALVVDRAGLVVDQPPLLGAWHKKHLVDVAVVAALAGDHPQVAGVAQ